MNYTKIDKMVPNHFSCFTNPNLPCLECRGSEYSKGYGKGTKDAKVLHDVMAFQDHVGPIQSY